MPFSRSSVISCWRARPRSVRVMMSPFHLATISSTVPRSAAASKAPARSAKGYSNFIFFYYLTIRAQADGVGVV